VLGEESPSGTVPPMPAWDTDRLVTYSRSITIDLTYRCLARCGYCEYRKDEGGLITAAEAWLFLASQLRRVEVVGTIQPKEGE